MEYVFAGTVQVVIDPEYETVTVAGEALSLLETTYPEVFVLTHASIVKAE
jgi:hypothetical protein